MTEVEVVTLEDGKDYTVVKEKATRWDYLLIFGK